MTRTKRPCISDYAPESEDIDDPAKLAPEQITWETSLGAFFFRLVGTSKSNRRFPDKSAPAWIGRDRGQLPIPARKHQSTHRLWCFFSSASSRR